MLFLYISFFCYVCQLLGDKYIENKIEMGALYPTACKQSLWRVNVLYAAAGMAALYRRRPPSAQQQQQQREPISTNTKINGQTTGKLHPKHPRGSYYCTTSN
jgi:hypothetical protein